MFLADYHLHTKFSPDCDEEIDNICLSAIDGGVSEIAITDHLCVNRIFSGRDPIYKDDEAKKYIFNAKEKYEDKLSIVYGIELGQPFQCPSMAKESVEKNKYEFIIGSLHNITNVEDFYYMDFSKLSDEDIKNLYDRYVEELFEHIQWKDFHVLSHITYPLKYLYINNRSYDFSVYYDRLRELFKNLIALGKGLEINTSGLRSKIGETLPNMDVAKIYYDCGGEIITVGSDSHDATTIGSNIKQTYKNLYDIGFKYISTFPDGKLKQNKI